MNTTSREFQLNRRSIKIANAIDEFDNSKIYTNRYLFTEINGQRVELI